jgi:Domain of unknown function (DUF4286)
MLIYNVTTKVDWGIHEAWLQWMQKEHIPAVVNTGCFIKSQLLHLLETDESDGPTYAVQYFAASITEYNHYLTQFAPSMRKEVTNRWGNQVVAFRSLMQVVD